jgi:hypothetical protein
MRKARLLLPVLAVLALACGCPATAGIQGTIEAMQGTVGAVMTEMPAMLTELPVMLSEMPPTFEPEAETPEPELSGIIRGRLSYPSEFIPAQRIVAFDVGTMAFVADVLTADGQGEYELTVPPGDYYIVTYLPDSGMAAGYSQMVPCGLSVGCTDHSLIPVHVGPGDIVEDIDPQDWYAPPGTFPPMP